MDIQPCYNCGKDWVKQDELIDTVYPSKREFINGSIVFTEWIVVCQIHNTGCGRTVYGSSKQEAIERWNASYTDDVDELYIRRL